MALFETEEGDSEISLSGRYFGKRFGIPLFQIVHDLEDVKHSQTNTSKFLCQYS